MAGMSWFWRRKWAGSEQSGQDAAGGFIHEKLVKLWPEQLEPATCLAGGPHHSLLVEMAQGLLQAVKRVN